MKRIICLFTACLSFFIFYLSFSTYSLYERYNMNYFYRFISEQTHTQMYIYQINMNNMEQDLENIQKFAKEHRYIALLGKDSMSGITKIDDNFLYDYDGSHVSFFTKQGKTLSFADNSDSYISTDLRDNDCYDWIDFIDQRNHKLYQDIVRFHSFSQYAVMANDIKRNNIFLFTDLPYEEHQALMQNSEITYLLEAEAPLGPFTKEKEDLTTVLQIMAVCAISICLLFICQSIKNRKEIMLRRMMGCNALQITRKLMLKQMLIYLTLYIVVQIVCYRITVGDMRPATHPFYMILLKYAILFILFLSIIYGIVFIYIQKNRKFIRLKESGQSKAVVWLNMGLKFFILLLIFPTFLQFAKQGWTETYEYYYLTVNEDDLRNQVYVASIEDRQNNGNVFESSMELHSKMNTFLDEHGGIYQDFGNYEARHSAAVNDPSDEWAKSFLPYIIVNRNYLKDYELLSENGTPIDLDTIKEVTLFVPQNREFDEQTRIEYCNTECDIVPIKPGNEFWNRTMMSSIRSLKDPLVVYSPEVYLTGWYHLNISDDTVKKELATFLKENRLERLFALRNTSDDYDVTITKYQDHLLYLLPLFITYVIVILMFIYQSAYIYFTQNKQRFVLCYLLGKSFSKRHGEMLYRNLLVYSPMLVFLYVLMDVTALETILCVLLAALFELGCAYLMIHILEKRYMVDILKGDS